MKIITRIFVAVISLAAIGFLVIVMVDPQKGAVLQEKLENLVNQRGEAMEVTPVRELSIAYELPLENDEVIYGEYGFRYGLDPEFPDKVYTWFRDLGRDLWLPFYMDDTNHCTLGEAVLLDQEGVVKRLKDGDCSGDSALGEAVIYASALSDVPEGDYWVALLISPDEPEEPDNMPYYVLRYVGIYEECTFHTEDYDISTGNGGQLLVDRSKKEDFTFHLLNLGDNIVTDVWKLENMMGQFTRKHLKAGEEYIVSEDGASVTLTAEYLDSLQDLYGYWFLFGLADHSEVSHLEVGDGKELTIFLTDGPIQDPPYINGADTYSVSSGEDYVFTLHLGRAPKIMENGGGVYAYDGDWAPLVDENGREIRFFTFTNGGIGEDETCVIPADVLKDIYERGGRYINYGITFTVTEFAASGYYPYKGMTIHLEP